MQHRRLDGKVAIVTAATAGIGLGIAQRLGQEGARVVICSRKQANVDETLRQLKSQGIEAAGCAANVGRPAHLQALVDLAIEQYSKIDILVSNAAVNPAAGDILDMPESAIDKVLDVNIKSAIILAQLVRPHLPLDGSIVFISSFSAYAPIRPIALYAISKTTLVALTKALAEELGPSGVRVNCVAPGTIPTKFASALVEDPEQKRQNEERTFLGRLGKPSEIAAVVAFLVSSDASYITGETIVAGGGMHARL